MSVFSKLKQLKSAYSALGDNRWERIRRGLRKFGFKETVRRGISLLRVNMVPTYELDKVVLDSESEPMKPADQLEARTHLSFTALLKRNNLSRMELLTENTNPTGQSRLTVHVYEGDTLLGRACIRPVAHRSYTKVTFPAIGEVAGKTLRYEVSAQGDGAGILVNPAAWPGFGCAGDISPVCRIYGKDGPDDYAAWISFNTPSRKELARQRASNLGPGIAVAVFGSDEGTLAKSLTSQTHANWELSDRRASTIGCLLRSVLDSTDAPYIAVAKGTDSLEPNALHEILAAIADRKGCILAYADDDRLNEAGVRRDPFFKPDYSPFYLLSFNYIGHFIVLSRDLAEKVAAAGATTVHDAVLRAAQGADEVVHVRTVLSHIAAGDVRGVESGEESGLDRKAIEDAMARRGMPGSVCEGHAPGFWNVSFHTPDPAPSVSVIIPSHDEADVLKACMDSLLGSTTYPNYEVLIVENNSNEPATFEYYKELEKDPRVRIVTWNEPGFNFASVNNWAAQFASGELVLFLNNDTTIVTPDWMDRMAALASQPEVGAVGAKLLYPDDTIQHGGVIIRMHGIAEHAHKGAQADDPGSFGRLTVPFDVSANTGACLMTKKAIFDELGGFDDGFVLAFNDVDLCYRIRNAGYSLIFEPRAQLYHYESKTRGYEVTPEQQKRFQDEQYLWMKKWHETCYEDPFFNPNLRYDSGDFAVSPEPTGTSAERVGKPYDLLLADRMAQEARNTKKQPEKAQ